MRNALLLALLTSVSGAQAGEHPQLETTIGGCLVIPVEVEGHFRAVLEITLDSENRPRKVDVIDYEPKSDATAKAAAKLAMQLQKKCWPAEVKEKSPIRLTFSIDI